MSGSQQYKIHDLQDVSVDHGSHIRGPGRPQLIRSFLEIVVLEGCPERVSHLLHLVLYSGPLAPFSESTHVMFSKKPVEIKRTQLSDPLRWMKLNTRIARASLPRLRSEREKSYELTPSSTSSSKPLQPQYRAPRRRDRPETPH
jgi:hypothetical protein